MNIKAYKYQGAGNDFVIIDNREGEVSLSPENIRQLCHRRFGIGADGLMLLAKSEKYDFSMKFFNADGSEGSMCGNGGRCLVAFAYHRGIKNYHFEAIDGEHHATVLVGTPIKCIVELEMIDVNEVKEYSPKSFFLNTGSPHLVNFVEKLKDYDVLEQGKFWRHHPSFPGGTNVNFVQGNWGRSAIPDGVDLYVRTFERGVEDETYACGTGVTASAIAYHKLFQRNLYPYGTVSTRIQTVGDILDVKFDYNGADSYTNIKLKGPATFVFSCDVEI
ncbi:MAG: diaminopimelate epimerase [Bacteroidales bacterium]|nr:diaminopimelate epimerase [Bacteroidales bacterium]